MISSQYLGVFPGIFPGRDRIDWLPVDKVSKVLLEILRSASADSATELTQIFHVVNPQAGSWASDIAAAVVPMYPKGDISTVTMEHWVEKLRLSVDEAAKTGNFDIETSPALRLLDFFSNTVSGSSTEQRPRWLSSLKAEQSSNTLRDLGPLKKDWLWEWMVQWGIIPEC